MEREADAFTQVVFLLSHPGPDLITEEPGTHGQAGQPVREAFGVNASTARRAFVNA